jgi:hypothetical protein
MSSDQPHDASAPVDETGLSKSSLPGSERRTAWMPGVGLALVGGILAWAILEASYPVMTMPRELYRMLGTPPDVVQASLARADKMAMVNPMFALAVVGGILGGALAVSHLGAQPSRIGGLVAALAAVLVGAGFGCLSGFIGYTVHRAGLSAGPDAELSKTLAMHIAVFSTLGAGVGLGVGAFSVRIWKAAGAGLLAGAAAGLLAGAAFPVLMAIIAPAVDSSDVIPDGRERLLWIGLPALLLGLAVPLFTECHRAVQGKTSAQ